MSGWFARKSIESLIAESENPTASMRRTLGLFSLTCFGVGSTIGAGIFVLTGTVAAAHSGPAVVLSFVLASIACALAGLCYAEFASMVPVAGSAYTYAYATLGEVVAWIIGWCLVLEYLFASSLVAIGWAGYAMSTAADLGLVLPTAFTQAPFDVTSAGIVATGSLCNAPAVGVVALCTVLLLAGTTASTRINNVIVAASVATILTVGIAGLALAQPQNWTPFVPPNTGKFGEFGASGILTGAAIVFYAYVGFDTVSSMSQETRNAQRTVPWALIAALTIVTILYVIIALMVTGLRDYRTLGVPDPVYAALTSAGPALAWAKPLVGAVVVVGLMSSLLVALLGQVRMFYAMARDGLLPKPLMALHPKTRTPHIGTILTGLTAALIAGLFPLRLLGELISIGTLLAFAIVCACVIVLRHREPDLPRPFRVPAYPWVPIGGIFVCVGYMASLPKDTWIRLGVWLAIGLLIYAGYGRRRSRLRDAADRQAQVSTVASS